jgi:pyrimidine-nucleoside phosphorylase
MRAVDIIAKKRDGLELSGQEISFVVRGYTSGQIPDYQMAALLMAIYLRGMSPDETLALTREMIHSGAVIDFSALGRPCVDKHSTGGVGDKTSLILAPTVAAAGVPVPMISGRALGHTGGTLDKLEAIPGFRTDLRLAEFKAQVASVGAALIGQTEEIAPADRKLYALRDVTATVASMPLMAASIMSKKMAEGIAGLVLDIKVGSGAFLKTEAEAIALAELMLSIAREMKRECAALITDMDQPIGRAVGNALEVIEAFQALSGRGPDDLNKLCRELAANMLVLGRASETVEDGRQLYEELIRSGAALEKMRQIIRAQGGDPRAVDDHQLLPQASGRLEVKSPQTGYVRSIDAEALGRASMILGAGRARLGDEIDPSVGLIVEAKLGDWIESGSTLVALHFNDPARARAAAQIIEQAYQIGPEPAPHRELIKATLRSH